MPSLDEAYGRETHTEWEPWRVRGGLFLGVVGALAVLAAIGLVAAAGDTTAGKAQAGILAGLGVPAMFLAVVFVLPASTRQRLGVVVGSVVTVFGVVLFSYAYPTHWTGTADPLAFETAVVYGAGSAVALWHVFAALATVRLRNVPQGTVELEVVRNGGTRTLEVSPDQYQQIVSDGGDASAVIAELDDRETDTQTQADAETDIDTVGTADGPDRR